MQLLQGVHYLLAFTQNSNLPHTFENHAQRFSLAMPLSSVSPLLTLFAILAVALAIGIDEDTAAQL